MRLAGLRRTVLGLSIALAVLGEPIAYGGVSNCQDVSRARPGLGTAFRGHVDNPNYGFSADIPAGLTGWGAGPGAPFHGFMIYLNQNTCIDFEVGIEVELPQDSDRDRPAKKPDANERIKVGNRVGTRITETGAVNGTVFENVAITLNISHPGRTDYVYITLVAPVARKATANRKLQEFIDSLKFQ